MPPSATIGVLNEDCLFDRSAICLMFLVLVGWPGPQTSLKLGVGLLPDRIGADSDSIHRVEAPLNPSNWQIICGLLLIGVLGMLGSIFRGLRLAFACI